MSFYARHIALKLLVTGVFCLFFVLNGEAKRKHAVSVFEVKMHNNAPISYRLIGPKMHSYRITGALPVYKPGKYDLEIYSGHESSNRLVFTAKVSIPANKLVEMVYDPSFGLQIAKKERLRRTRKALKKEGKVYQIDTISYKNEIKHLPLTDNSFDDLLTKINDVVEEEQRMDRIKEAIASHHFTAWQVRQMTQKLSEEDNKVLVAAYAYFKTVDAENYIQLFDCIEKPYNKYKLHVLIDQRMVQ